jgi:hypothetical protein
MAFELLVEILGSLFPCGLDASTSRTWRTHAAEGTKKSHSFVSLEDPATWHYAAGLASVTDTHHHPLSRTAEHILTNSPNRTYRSASTTPNTRRATFLILLTTIGLHRLHRDLCLDSRKSCQKKPIFCHAQGLIPIKADPTEFAFLGDDGEFDEDNHLIFSLDVTCSRNPDATAADTNPDKLYINSKVTSGMLKWVPQGNQKERFETIGPVRVFVVVC